MNLFERLDEEARRKPPWPSCARSQTPVTTRRQVCLKRHSRTLGQVSVCGWRLADPVEDRSTVSVGSMTNAGNTRRGNAGEDRRALSRPPASTSGSVKSERWLGRLQRRPHERERPGYPFPDPEISTALDGEPRTLRALQYLHSERLEGLFVEAAAASHVTYSQGQMVDEGKGHGQQSMVLALR